MKYTVTIEFDTDKALNESEQTDLLDSLSLQVEEPQTNEGEDAGWSASEITINTKEGE